MLFKLSKLNSNRALTLGYLNPALNNSALVFYKKKTMWFIGVEAKQETSAPPPKKNPGSAPATESDLSPLVLSRTLRNKQQEMPLVSFISATDLRDI